MVYKGDGSKEAGAHTLTWNGKDLNGVQLPDGGVYTLAVNSKTADGTDVTSHVTLKGPVTDVNIVSGSPVLSVNGVPVQQSTISTIHQPGTTSS